MKINIFLSYNKRVFILQSTIYHAHIYRLTIYFTACYKDYYITYYDRTLPGSYYVVEDASVNTPELCAAACEAILDCTGFTLDGNRCGTFKVADVSAELSTFEEVNTYFRPACDAEGTII